MTVSGSLRSVAVLSLSLMCVMPIASRALGQAASTDDPKTEEQLAGHSYHGEVFNEGARQSAYLMDGLSPIEFEVTSETADVGNFVRQGIAQLHGFWYFEAERSFRQAAALDADCAIAYWGMAMANANNEKRAKDFSKEAVARKDQAGAHERRYIEALDRYLQNKDKKKRAQQYTKDLESICYDYPDDVEAKALLALQLWQNRRAGVPIVSHLAIDGLLDKVFAANPMHPAHHYRIHLWDSQRPSHALASSALCGQSSPAIAHMWHMPGHIFSKLKRYEDACWQQEASARVDHAHMMRDRVMPDQIHNFAHNNEWLIRNLIFVGRVQDGIDLAKNMIEMPRHPKYNTLTKRGSYNYGRMRLAEVTTRFERWDDLIAACEGRHLDPTESTNAQIKRLRNLGMAYYHAGRETDGDEILTDLQDRRAKTKSKSSDAQEKDTENQKDGESEKDSADEKGSEVRAPTRRSDRRRSSGTASSIEKAILALEGHQAFVAGDFDTADKKLRQAGGVDAVLLARAQAGKGDIDGAVKALQGQIRSRKNEVQPIAGLASVLWEAGRIDEAKQAMNDLRKLSSSIDLNSPVFDRLQPLVKHLGWEQDWRAPLVLSDDIGDRPSLDDLGPFRWSPSRAESFSLLDSMKQSHALHDYEGRPVVIIFYLGYGCLHCAEQLHAFAPMTERFNEAGISLIAISTDDLDGLKTSLADFEDGDFPFPLVSDESQETFKAYRCRDDFEEQPLHGTFIIDSKGLIRWQDISYEPFMDAEFVLDEALRLMQY